jgi:predicted aconitase with swiveling domain
MADRVIAGRPIVEGAAEGEALVTTEALSFWGGYDFHTGRHERRQADDACR